MTGIFEREPGKRWPRSQKFKLSDKGAQAEASYREMIVKQQTGTGRASFDAARALWAEPLQLQPNDGLFLAELHTGPRTMDELIRALDECGTTRREVKEAVDRMTSIGMIDALPTLEK